MNDDCTCEPTDDPDMGPVLDPDCPVHGDAPVPLDDCTCTPMDDVDELILDPACPVHGIDSVEPLPADMTVEEAERLERQRREAAIRAANANQGFEVTIDDDEVSFFETGRVIILEGVLGEGENATVAYRFSTRGMSEPSVMAASELVYEMTKAALLRSIS